MRNTLHTICTIFSSFRRSARRLLPKNCCVDLSEKSRFDAPLQLTTAETCEFLARADLLFGRIPWQLLKYLRAHDDQLESPAIAAEVVAGRAGQSEKRSDTNIGPKSRFERLLRHKQIDFYRLRRWKTMQNTNNRIMFTENCKISRIHAQTAVQ